MGRKRKAPELVGEVLAGSDSEQEHKERLRKYSGAKKHAVAVADYILTHEGTLFNEAELLQACSTWLIFRYFYNAGQYRMIGGCTCKKHLLCAMCALRRSAKTVMAYSAKIGHVMTENPGAIPVLLTLTVKNGPDLDERMQHLENAFSRMVRNRSNAKSGTRHTTVFRLVHGAAGAFEFKRGKGSGLWHPHIHLYALVDAGTDLMAMEWDMSEEWRKLTKDSHNVDVCPLDVSTEDKKLKAICEVFRYALKFGEMEIEDQVHAYKVLRGKRLVRDFGSLHGVKIPDDLHDTVEDELKLQPYIDLIYEYSKSKGYFLKETKDTGDQYTGPGRPKKTEGEKAAVRLSARLVTSIPDPDSTGPKKIVLDRKYMDAWVEEHPAVVPALEEAPF